MFLNLYKADDFQGGISRGKLIWLSSCKSSAFLKKHLRNKIFVAQMTKMLKNIEPDVLPI